MAEPQVSVLLRNCLHSAVNNGNVYYGYALKCDQAAITYAKTPIQVPIPRNSPQLIDLGIYRPSLSINGTVDTIGGNTSENTTGREGMESFLYTRVNGNGGSGTAMKYYIPYKNALESFCMDQVFTKATPLELEIGDANYPISTSSIDSTGGAVYEVALQQFRCQVDAAKEDRYSFSMQFVVGDRKDS